MVHIAYSFRKQASETVRMKQEDKEIQAFMDIKVKETRKHGAISKLNRKKKQPCFCEC